MSLLNKDERKELERYRARAEYNAKLSWALTKGTIFSFIFIWITRSFSLDNLLWRRGQMLGIFACLVVGFLSSYFGPFKGNKAVIT